MATPKRPNPVFVKKTGFDVLQMIQAVGLIYTPFSQHRCYFSILAEFMAVQSQDPAACIICNIKDGESGIRTHGTLRYT
jgi:hypothetical protein